MATKLYAGLRMRAAYFLLRSLLARLRAAVPSYIARRLPSGRARMYLARVSISARGAAMWWRLAASCARVSILSHQVAARFPPRNGSLQPVDYEINHEGQRGAGRWGNRTP